MGIRVTGTTVNSNEISSNILIEFPEGMSASSKNIVKDQAGELIIDHILSSVGNARSPISGADWPPLSKDYRDQKRDDGRGTKANLELNGDMLDALAFTRTAEGLRVGIVGGEAPKADGHNNFSGRSEIPTRKFLPEEGETFKGTIEMQIEALVSDQLVTSVGVTRSDIRGITTKRELNSFLRASFVGLTLRQAKNAVLFDDALRRIFSPLLEFF